MYIIWFKNVNIIYIYIIDNLKATYIRYTRIISFPSSSGLIAYRLFLPFWSIPVERPFDRFIQILKRSRLGILRMGQRYDWNIGEGESLVSQKIQDEVLDLQLMIDKRRNHSDIFPFLREKKICIIWSISSFFTYPVISLTFALPLSNKK